LLQGPQFDRYFAQQSTIQDNRIGGPRWQAAVGDAQKNQQTHSRPSGTIEFGPLNMTWFNFNFSCRSEGIFPDAMPFEFLEAERQIVGPMAIKLGVH